jgi:hypothetical protein
VPSGIAPALRWDRRSFESRDSVLTPSARARTIRAVDDLEPIDPREAERIRRRDHDADAESRSLMRPGMGKVFKQIQDSWAFRPAKKPPKPRRPPRS